MSYLDRDSAHVTIGDDNTVRCGMCGVSYRWNVPVPLRMFCKGNDAFVREHLWCEEWRERWRARLLATLLAVRLKCALHGAPVANMAYYVCGCRR